MALTVYVDNNTDFDSFISLADADTYITETSIHSADWLALSTTDREVYLRIACNRILSRIDETLLDGNACLAKANASMAIHDVVYKLSSDINPNTGLVTREKVGDLEVDYFHGGFRSSRQIKGIVTDPFPSEVKKCLSNYGFIYGCQVTLEHS